MKKNILAILVLLSLFLLLSACNSGGFYYVKNANDSGRYEEHSEIAFIDTTSETEMYLSLDNSSYSYSDIRNYINNQTSVPVESVNIEEMLNYFSYGYEEESEGINIKVEVSECPWNSENLLETICLFAPLTGERLPSNITFLVDVSGSMSGDDRIGLFKDAFEAVLPYLNETDKVSIVTYASNSKILMNGESGKNKTKILSKIQSLKASGSTNGSGGIEKAYKVAHENFIENGVNHIFIVTDGDFNVGISNEEELGKYVRGYANEGIYLSIFGVGMGNTKQSIIETIKKNGEGNCYYLDSVKEASKALEQALKGGMKVLSKDTKAKVSFDPEYVKSYRVIGYDNKLLTEEEYEDEDTNAGEIFEGYEVMICFEIVPTELQGETISTVEVKFKDYKTLEEKTISKNSVNSNSDRHIFASLVTEFGLILRQSAYKSNANYSNILSRAENIKAYIESDDSKLEFIELVNKASAIENTDNVNHYYNK